MKNTVKYWFGPLFHLFFPRCCAVCGASLIEGEDTICTRCNIDMPRTNYHKMKDNPVERMFWGKFPLERATSYFFYRKGSDFRRILHQLKYGGRKELGAVMGRCMAAELLPTGFFEDVDVVISDCFCDFDIGAIHSSECQCAIQHKFHISGSGCFLGGQGNLLGNITCRNHLFSHGYIVVFYHKYL